MGEPSAFEMLPEEFFLPLILKHNRSFKDLYLENLSVLLFGQFFKDFMSSIMHSDVKFMEFGCLSKLPPTDRWGLKNHPYIIDSKDTIHYSPKEFSYKFSRDKNQKF